MRKLMTILVTILVVLVLMAGGIWGYLWLQHPAAS
jgi:hypothetical protein